MVSIAVQRRLLSPLHVAGAKRWISVTGILCFVVLCEAKPTSTIAKRRAKAWTHRIY
jgi:hypothetical protein